MAKTRILATTRGLSLLLGALAVVLPYAFYSWQAIQITHWAEAEDAYVCGLPLLAAAALAVLFSGLLSALAFAIGLTSYRDLPRPRPKKRAVELALVGLPAILLAGGLLAAVLSGMWV